MVRKSAYNTGFTLNRILQMASVTALGDAVRQRLVCVWHDQNQAY